MILENAILCIWAKIGVFGVDQCLITKAKQTVETRDA